MNMHKVVKVAAQALAQVGAQTITLLAIVKVVDDQPLNGLERVEVVVGGLAIGLP
jgi:hypothetical protein